MNVNDYFDLRHDREQRLVSVKIGDAVIRNEISKMRWQIIKDTKYEKKGYGDFRYGGLRQPNKIRLDLTYQHYKAADLVGPILNKKFYIDGHIVLSVINNQFNQRYEIEKISSPIGGGIGGILLDYFNSGSIFAGFRLTDMLKTIENLKSKPEVFLKSDCLDSLRNNGILLPCDVKIDDTLSGVWFVFKYTEPNRETIIHLIEEGKCP